ncbi:MAG: aminoacetone oxidase family FAD-binding enzyme [Victivallales bacterium]|nr:aminoacetone oxidase family FAD-binding enzyme [Victivallales bacterium]
MNTDLIIIGAGAAGLFAACGAADAGLKAVLLERRHRAGLKLLMCGNNRCNLSHAGNAEDLLRAYGPPVRDFLDDALRALPPTELQRWLQMRLGLHTKVLGNRIYPASEKGDDVLHAFLDHLRDRDFPVIYSAPAEEIQRVDGGYRVNTPNFSLETRCLLLAIGGFSYPRTGSVGDGEPFGRMLGIPFEEPRAGLVGLSLPARHPIAQLPTATDLPEVTVGVPGLPAITGNLLIENGVLRGAAIFDLTRLAARQRHEDFRLSIDFFPQETAEQLARRYQTLLSRTGQPRIALNALGLPPMLAEALARDGVDAAGLKDYRPGDLRPRPLKEAIVTVGGLSRSAFDPATMQCRSLPGLYAAGEVLDIDGPTGGYNLHAAFATAHLAILHLVKTLRQSPSQSARQRSACASPDAPRRPRRSGDAKDPRKSAWGKHFWDGKRPMR